MEVRAFAIEMSSKGLRVFVLVILVILFCFLSFSIDISDSTQQINLDGTLF